MSLPEQPEEKQARFRSPAYPSDGLETCFKWARKIYEAEKRSITSAAVVAKHMGYSTLSGPSRTKVSAMKKFGLLTEEGPDRVRLSEDAIRALVAPEEQRLPLLRALAIRPEIIAELLAEHPDGLPSDESLRYKLVADRAFSEEAAATLTKALRETVRFAKLGPAESEPSSSDAHQEVRTIVVAADERPLPRPLDVRNPWQQQRAEQLPAMIGMWGLGKGVTVEMRATAPLTKANFELLKKYIELAALAAEDAVDPLE
jgi:hypothetical protein